MTECINLVVTKETTSEEILAFILTDSQYHTFKIGKENWTFINTFDGCGHLVNCRPKDLGDWYYDDELARMKNVFDESVFEGDCDEYLAMIGNPWHTYSDLAEAIVVYVQTN